jgi:protein gp37
MGSKTGIAWTDATWNPWYGCTHVSPGCDNMYAEQRRYGNNPEIVKRARPATFNAPLKWKAGRVFTCSWSDFFISDADEWRDEAWDIIRRTPHLTYQVLTKRPVLIKSRLPKDWGDGWPNVWLGVSVENSEQLKRLDGLKDIPNVMPWVSAEPLLEDISRELITGRYDWVRWWVWGGESGPDARTYDIDWPRNGMLALPKATHFHKQAGSKMSLVDRKGGDPSEWPQDLRVREFPR